MKKFTYYCFAAVLVMLCIGCATGGKNFDSSSRSQLVTGKTTQTEAEQLLGKPLKSNTVTNADGTFQISIYAYSSVNLASGSVRALFLEFNKNLLNAYSYNSGFPDDSTAFNYDAYSQITKGVSNKNDVIKILSTPSGKALCPSSLAKCKGKSENSIEAWLWAYTSNVKGLDSKTIKTKRVTVLFDRNGIVTDVEGSIGD